MDDALRGALTGLAENPAAPPDVLLRLAAEPLAASRMAWREALPEEVVERLLATGGVRVALGLDSRSRSELTRQRIAAHPEAGVRGARRTFVEDSIRHGVRVGVESLAWYAGAGGLLGLARHEDPVLRAAVARSWEGMPEGVRRELLVDSDPRVRQLAAGYPHPPVPEDLRSLLLADPATRREVAAYAVLTPEAVREGLAGDEDLRGSMAINPTLPAAARGRLEADPSPYVRAKVLLRQDLSEDRRRLGYAALAEAGTEEFDDVWIALTGLEFERPSWLADLPLADRVGYLDSPIPCFRRTAASSPDLPPEVLRRLDEHPDVEVRRIVARRPDCPGEVLERLVIEHGEHAKTRPLLIEHPNFPPSAFARLATATAPDRRALAAHGAELPGVTLAALARDPEAHVRAAAARNPRTPVAALVALLADEPAAAQAAGANPGLPVADMCAVLDRAGLQ
ncbi:hypothetical protein M8C13_24335 [Crossiella sp. SN42]|uniref:hypothetical protein n=1 Tax=Crossiella sp. SN42 TaxID=2944808 RepID=UPI00207D26B2|nr:hypothetical protein [Crossiella sp. SN42]MCO1578888.1 hypothetical protein [Crossiella sp. SN42]